MEEKTTFATENFNDGSTPKWAEVARYILKIGIVAIPVVCPPLGVTAALAGGIATILMTASEGLKMFSKK